MAHAAGGARGPRACLRYESRRPAIGEARRSGRLAREALSSRTPAVSRSPLRWMGFVLALVAALVLATALGTIPLSPAQVWSALFGRGDAAAITVVQVLRLPRAVLAAL